MEQKRETDSQFVFMLIYALCSFVASVSLWFSSTLQYDLCRFALQYQYQSTIGVCQFCWLFFIMLMVTNRICLLQVLADQAIHHTLECLEYECAVERVCERESEECVCVCGWGVSGCRCILCLINIYAPLNIFLQNTLTHTYTDAHTHDEKVAQSGRTLDGYGREKINMS